MSNKRTTAARRRTVKERRRESVADAREEWSDDAFGLSMVAGGRGSRGGRYQVRWEVDRDPYRALMGLDRLRRSVIDQLEVELVAECRSQHALSWADCGWALGVSGEALRKRLAAVVAARDEVLA